MFAYPFFALTRQQLKTENNKLNIYTQYLMKSTFETIWLFVHRPVGLVELLISYARVQFYTPRASDYRLISNTGFNVSIDCGFMHRWDQTKDNEIGICCFSIMHSTLRRKSKDWLAQNQDNVSEWGDMSIHRQSRHHHNLIKN